MLALALAAVLANWITTGDHIIQSLSQRHLWNIAGIDAVILAGGVAALYAARRLNQPPPGSPQA